MIPSGEEWPLESSASQEERLRADHYRLLSRLLAGPPDDAFLQTLRTLLGDESDLGKGLSAIAEAARSTTAERAAEEYHELFIGMGRGELVPFGSFYLTGFLNEKPLAKLRQDMVRLGIARADDVHEPEDHIAAVCEMMAGLIIGDFGAAADLTEQRRFFDRHLEPWAAHFFEDLETAKAATLYRPVGSVGRLFMGIEATAFSMMD